MKLKLRIARALVNYAGRLSGQDVMLIERLTVCPGCIANALACLSSAGQMPKGENVQALAKWMHDKDATAIQLADLRCFTPALADEMCRMYSYAEKYEHAATVQAAMQLAGISK